MKKVRNEERKEERKNGERMKGMHPFSHIPLRHTGEGETFGLSVDSEIYPSPLGHLPPNSNRHLTEVKWVVEQGRP